MKNAFELYSKRESTLKSKFSNASVTQEATLHAVQFNLWQCLKQAPRVYGHLLTKLKIMWTYILTSLATILSIMHA